MPSMRTGSSQTCGSFVPARSNDTVGPSRWSAAFSTAGWKPRAEVEHHVGVEDLVDLVGGELEVVGFGAGGGQVRDLDAVAADALDCVRDRIGARDHRSTRGLRAGADRGPDHDHPDQTRQDSAPDR